ncbi:MAG TPA: hypothetical protein VKG24_15800 [Pseudolabrys sp.]|nr:hypothetical protein [Pseudolabrys sp.]
MVQHKRTDELAARIAAADRAASEGNGRPQRGERLQVIIHEEDAEAVVKEKMEKKKPENCYCSALPKGSGLCLPCYTRWLAGERPRPANLST